MSGVRPAVGAALALLCGTGQLEAVAQGAAPETAQEAVETTTVQGRVLAVAGPRRFTVDRGSLDGIEGGDVVRLVPLSGPALRGRVVSVAVRSAEVRLTQGGAEPRPGMQVEVDVPTARLNAPEPEPVIEAPAESDGAEGSGGDESEADGPASRWSNDDDGWNDSMPLLAGIDPVLPSERAPEVGGRIYAISDVTRTSDEGRSTQFHRVGVDLWGENWFGRGEQLRLDAEWNREVANLPDQNDERQNRLRIDRLSYAEGGTRFDSSGFEVGRFLHRGLPELGVLDGVEWFTRLEGGDSFGVSLGFLPEPNEEFESGEDLAISMYYRWVYDPTEVLTATLGLQKTWHNLEADRDLLVARFDYLPRSGWRIHGSTLVDYYSGSDFEAGRSFGVTQAWLTGSRRWGDRFQLDLRYRHWEFPTLDRTEFLPEVLDQQLEDDFRDRVSVDARLKILPLTRLRAGVGGWLDEDDSGGDARVGLDLRGDSMGSSSVYTELFGVDGRFTTVWGARAGVGLGFAAHRVDLFYELANQDQKGFLDNNDDFVQQRGRLAYTYDASEGLTFSLYGDGTTFNSEHGYTLGAFVQWSF